MSKVLKALYVGECGGGVIISDLGNLEVRHGEPFSCPEDWIRDKVASDPTRWKVASAMDVEAYEKKAKAAAATVAIKAESPKE